MKKKILPLVLLTILAAVPAFAVFNERNFAKTLSILRSELHQENAKMENMRSRLSQSNEGQHQQLVEMTKRCNELSLILYSQSQDYTFDMTYALDEVTRQYDDYEKQRMPFDEIITRLNFDIERYEHLAEALRRLPPVLDKIDILPDSLSAVMDSIAVNERHHDHDHGQIYDSTGRYIAPEEALTGHIHETSEQDLFFDDEDEPFFLDKQGCEDRDSCLFYVLNLLEMYTAFRDRIIIDNDHYEAMSSRLQESYNYARERYRLIQKHIFIDGQDNYFKVIGSFPRYSRMAIQDTRSKYGLGGDSPDTVALRQSEWRGPMINGFTLFILFYILVATLISRLVIHLLRSRVAWFQTEEFRQRRPIATLLSGVIIFALTVMAASTFVQHNFFQVASSPLLIYAWLLAATLASLLIRSQSADIRRISLLYLPIALLGLIVITFRIIFIPNRLINLIFPPILLIFTVWQYFLCKRNGTEKQPKQKETRGDMLYAWITFSVMLATTVVSWTGYVLLAIQVFIWWLFQLAAIETLTALHRLLDRYDEKHLYQRLAAYKKNHNVFDAKRKDSYISVTWFNDFIRQALFPILMILSVPICLWMAADIFDLTEVCKEFFFKPFFNLSGNDGSAILHLSLYKIVVVSTLFFLFRYVSYLLKAFYRKIRFEKLAAKEGKAYIHANEINFTLSDNIIAILVWGSYIAMIIVLLKIPMGALSIVAAGLATGLGLAMKDILNNFIYGIQLMSGRLRVGDFIECDGIRGKVTSISYQTTQIQTLEDTLIAFTNTTLFNKNFKNLTRGSAYEYVKVTVGISYGSDIDRVRKILLEAAQKLMTNDRFGRSIVDPKRGINVAIDSFADSSVDIALKQYVLVEEEPGYIARAKELIYNTLNENGIEIPFPQQDVYIKSVARMES